MKKITMAVAFIVIASVATFGQTKKQFDSVLRKQINCMVVDTSVSKYCRTDTVLTRYSKSMIIDAIRYQKKVGFRYSGWAVDHSAHYNWLLEKDLKR